MAKTTIRLWDNWPVITDEVKIKAKRGLNRAEETCLSTIQSEWPNGAGNFHTEGVSATVSGFKSGVSADNDKKHIAHFHDHGTLGHFRRGSRTTPKRPRKRNYEPLIREDGTVKGIKARRFYGKGRGAGKRALLRSLGI